MCRDRSSRQDRIAHRRWALSAFIALAAIAGWACGSSSGSGTEALECLANANCPPGCTCEGADMDLVGRCRNPDTQVECGGSCDGRTVCSGGGQCALSMSTDTLEVYACTEPGDAADAGGDGGAGGTSGPGDGRVDAGTSDAGGDAGSDETSDAGAAGNQAGTGGVGDAGGAGGNGGGAGDAGTRTLADRCADSTDTYCNNGYDCDGKGWGVDASDFEQLYGQSLQECLDFGTPCTTEEAYCSDRGLPGSYVPANHEACIDGQRSSSCEVDAFGLPVYPAVCDQICVE